jgi:KAP family P-loop domain
MMQVVKSIGDFSCFSYLLAYDPDRVAKALGGNDSKFGHNYLEKIVQVQTRLPRTPEAKMRDFILEQFDSGPPFDRAALKKLLDSLVPEIIYTPRDARRFAAAYAARSHVGNEVNSYDLLRYCALETRVPLLSERLQNLATRVSVDGSRELKRRSEPFVTSRDCLKQLLDVFHDNTALERIVLDLFPALDEHGAEIIVRDDNRLCYETSLLTLLNYGCPPNLVSMQEIEDVIADAPNIREGILKLLNRAASGERECLRHANLRLRTICNRKSVDNTSTQELWRSIAQFFDQPIARDEMGRWTPWVDAAHIWPRGVMNDYLPSAPITVDFVKELIEVGSMLLPSWVLFFHIQAHGLFGIKMRPSLRKVLEPGETTELSVLAAKLMTQNILEEEQSWRLRSFFPLLIIKLVSNDWWLQVVNHLSSPKSTLFCDGIAVLLLRTRHDKGPDGKALVDMVDARKIMQYWAANRDPKEETRQPVSDAYRFLHAATAGSG